MLYAIHVCSLYHIAFGKSRGLDDFLSIKREANNNRSNKVCKGREVFALSTLAVVLYRRAPGYSTFAHHLSFNAPVSFSICIAFNACSIVIPVTYQ